MNNVIKRVVVTEKSSGEVQRDKYTFYVDLNASKIQIKHALKEVFGVEAQTVNTTMLRGKKRRRGRIVGQTADRKKAVVTLKAGQNADKIKALY